MRKCQHRLPRGLARLRAGVEVHAHPLQRAGRRVVEGEIIDLSSFRGFFVFGLPDAHAELLVGVFSVPDVPQVLVDLARPEEFVRRRERRQRSSPAFSNQHAVPGFERHERVIFHAAELVLLRLFRRVPPDDARHRVGGKTLQARVVLVGHKLFVGLGQRIHPDQIGAAIGGELQAA